MTQVLRHSANAAALLGLEGEINGAAIGDLLGERLAHDLRNALGTMGDTARPALLFGQVGPNGGRFDIAVHSHRSTVIVEFEAVEAGSELPLQLSRTMVDRIARLDTVDSLVKVTARLVRSVLGYDRVMIYQFQADGSGKVISEAKRGDLESFLGQYFPFSDIPRQARALYLKNTIRIISSASYQPVRLNPQYDLSGEPLDLSYAHLRSVSPIHLEYLRNMGVGASMSISIIVDGELWGLIACHHYAPRTLPMGMRVAAELFGQFFSLHLGALRERGRLKVATQARAYLDHVLTLTTQHDVRDVLTERVADFARLMPNDGVALYIDGQWSAYGSTPSPADGMALARFIGGVADGAIWASHSLVQQLPAATAYAQAAAGVLAIPLSQTPRDYLLFFRKELTQTLDWAGNPDKTYETGPLGDRLTPRKSFAIWKQTVQQQSQPWTESDRQIAEATRVALVEVVMRHSELLQQERSKADLRQRMLNEELNHRVKNILSVIRSLVGQPPREGQTLRDYVEALKGRIQSLSFAHDQVVRGEGGGLLSELVNAELTPYRNQQTDIRVSDDRVWLDSRAYSVLALVLHELATNAAKYGALSVTGGKLEVRSSLEPTGECVLEWTETGGPRVTPPAREGFGTTLLNRSIPFDLGGESDLQYRPEGLRARFVLPARNVRRKFEAKAESQQLSGRQSADHPDLPRDLRIMLLEDQMLIAMDVESTLADRGFTSVSTVNSVAEALKLVNRAPPAIAILDINLGDGTSLPVAEELALRHIPFIFATGYGDGGIIPDRFADVPVIRKPYEAEALLAALNRIGRS